jgi:hypothetical protein
LTVQVEERARAISRWCDRHPYTLMILFSVFHFVSMFIVAWRKQFWFDELFTYYLVRLPTAQEISAELSKGVDHHPALYFLANRFLAGLFEDPHIGFRVHSILGYWILCVCLFGFVARRSSALLGLLSVLMTYLSGVRFWATDARPYGMSAGLAMAAFLAWQMAADRQKRVPWLVLLAGALAAGISTSYYFVLVLIPLGAAELVRWLRTGKWDWPVWLSTGVGASCAFLYLPAVARSVETFHPNAFARPSATAFLDIYGVFFNSLTLFTVGALMASGCVVLMRQTLEGSQNSEEPEIRAEDLTLALVLLLLPAIGVALAFAGLKVITARYVISTGTGLFLLAPLLVHRYSRNHATMGVALPVVAIVCLVPTFLYGEGRQIQERKVAVSRVSQLAGSLPEDAGPNLPIVFDDSLLMFEASHYSKPEQRARFRMLTYPAATLEHSGVYYSGRGLVSLQRYAPIRVQSYEEFRRNHRRFFYLESGRPTMVYMMATVQKEGAQIQLLAKRGPNAIYRIELPK